MKQTSFIRTLLGTSAIVAFGLSTPAFAQDSSTDDSVDDEVVVTGSRIKRDNFSSPVSMDVLNTEDAKIEGIADLGGLLQTATAASGSSQITNAVSIAYVSNGGVGAETIGLRGLGAGRTLDLINGRRAGPSGTRGSVDAFDLGSIPLVGVQRVDILKDGASALYGSDAIAGVVNYITDKSDNKEIDLYTELPENSGGEVYRLSATYGETFDKGRFRVTGDYYKREELARRDRSYLDCGVDYSFTDSSLSTRADVIDPRTGEPQCQGTIWGHVWVYDYGGTSDNIAQNPRNLIFQYSYPGDNLASHIPGIPTSVDGNGLVAPADWFQVEYFPADILNDRNDPTSGNLPAWVGVDVSDNGPNAVTNLYPEMQRGNTVTSELERITLMADAEYELTDNVTAYVEGLFNRRDNYVNAHQQYWTYQYGERAVFAGVDIPNPVYTGWSGTHAWFSPTPVVDHGDERVEVDYWRVLGGLKGDFGEGGPFPGWTWDAYVQHSDSKGEYTNQFVRQDSIQDNWWTTSSCVGTTSSGATATTNTGESVSVDGVPCVDVRWFDPNFLAGELTQGEIDFLLDEDTGRTDFTQTTIEGYVSGKVMDVPAGELGAALGVFYQRDEINDRPSDSVLTGNVFQGSQAGITTGVQSTKALYGELSIPLVKDKTFFEDVEMSLSGRYSEITSKHRDGRSISEDGFNYRATLNWRVSDIIRLRGSTGTSFRAPALFEQFLADESSSTRQSNIDPCIGWGNALTAGLISQQTATNCAAAGVPDTYNGAPIAANIFRGGGFGRLVPETSRNYTVGAVFTPDLGFGDLSLAVDYFDITVKDEIATLSPAAIVGGCYASQDFANEPLCDLFTRGADPGTGVFRLDNVTATFININDQSNRGIDGTLNFRKDTKWGEFDLNSQVSYQIQDEIQLLAESQIEFLNGGFGEPKWTGFANFTLRPSDALLVRWGMDYVGKTNGLRNLFDNTPGSELPAGGGQYTVNQDGTTVNYKTETEATIYHSLSAQYQMDGGWTFRAGVNNIFDEHPPSVSMVDLNFAYYGNTPVVSQYDYLGRRAFINVSKKFN